LKERQHVRKSRWNKINTQVGWQGLREEKFALNKPIDRLFFFSFYMRIVGVHGVGARSIGMHGAAVHGCLAWTIYVQ
jgi:hypothetical protein